MPPQRGEVYFVDLNPVVGREQSGTRPALVLSIDSINKLPLVVTVVIGTKGTNLTRDYRFNVRVPTIESGLPVETGFLCFQVRSIDVRRFPEKPAGRLLETAMVQVEEQVRLCMGL